MFGKRNTIVVHDNRFHSDDVFAVAILALFLEKKREKWRVIRTRDEDIITNAEYVLDVGGVYDPAKNRFDHHQTGGAGKRDNGIEYASCGLVWKHVGRELCTSEYVYHRIDRRLVAPIDAGDNGQDLCTPEFPGITEYGIQKVLTTLFRRSEGELSHDGKFLDAVFFAKQILQNELAIAEEIGEEIRYVQDSYEKSEDKKILVLDRYVSRISFFEATDEYAELLFVVSPDEEGKTWRVSALRKEKVGFQNKKDLSAEWAGLRNDDLQRVSGVSDAIFCHRALFLAVAGSKEGAIHMARIALGD